MLLHFHAVLVCGHVLTLGCCLRAPHVSFLSPALASAVLVWLFCVVRKKRQTEGTYRPSAEEQTGASSVETPDALKLPKEERLI
uniref:Crumbs homolog 3a n=1 Tax=Oncorhynchus mykiss TaxID=8022 RepID=A0A8K9UVU0_ONCMY